MDDDLFKYSTADTVRKLQTKLTRTGNTIQTEVLNNKQVRTLFTQEELDALAVASQALRSAKDKIAHVKEKKARVERQKELDAKNRKAQVQRAVKSLGCIQPYDHMDKDKVLLLAAAQEDADQYVSSPSEYDIDPYNADGLPPVRIEMIQENRIHSLHRDLVSALEAVAEQAWSYRFADDSYVAECSPKEMLQKTMDSLTDERREKLARRLQPYIDKIEAFNRRQTAKQMRGNFKAIEGGRN